MYQSIHKSLEILPIVMIIAKTAVIVLGDQVMSQRFKIAPQHYWLAQVGVQVFLHRLHRWNSRQKRQNRRQKRLSELRPQCFILLRRYFHMLRVRKVEFE